jgi:3-hydroxyisobutyrate dehydrogenase-like beta-hydroxyacid dehydrogenase
MRACASDRAIQAEELSMAVKTVGILSPGEMGAGVGAALGATGLTVLTCLAGRSPASSERARVAGIENVPDLATLVERCDVVLSILVPARASEVAAEVGDAARAAGASTVLADCNAIAPQTVLAMEADLEGSGVTLVDGGIVGGPPKDGQGPRVYVSGSATHLLSELDGRGIDVVDVGPEIGKASAVKMCYAAMTKGTTALRTALLVAARRLNVYDELIAEMEHSQAAALGGATQAMRRLPTVAYRWIGEMEEIASTFDHVGVTPDFHTGAAEVYRDVDATFGRDADLSDLADAVYRLAEHAR